MAIIEAGEPKRTGSGWGCTCRAFRQGFPDDAKLMAGIARASNVNFNLINKKDGIYEFEAWTKPEDVYHVVYDPTQEGGWCKHCAKCATYIVGSWLARVYDLISLAHPEYTKEKRRSDRNKRAIREQPDKCILDYLEFDIDDGAVLSKPLPPL